jgi:glycosyltransferase involved in cell wall biosynthesis
MEVHLKILIWARFSSHHFAIKNVITNICYKLKKDNKNNYTIITNKMHIHSFEESENVKIVQINIDPDDALKNHLYTLFFLPFYVLIKKYDMVVFPQISFYYIKTSKLIFYIHDLIEYKVDNQSKLALRLRKIFYKRIIKISDHIITVSNSSKKDIVTLFKYPENKISVIYNGRDENLIPIEKKSALKKIYGIYDQLRAFAVENYFLYIGYITHPQKNLLFVLDGIIDFIRQYDFFFILIGPNGKDSDLIHDKIDIINTNLGKKRVIALGTVDKNVLPYFYSAAFCFVFPSLYEGFGMPVIEAMSCACPVITSNTSSLKEISENYALLVDPNNIREFKDALEKVVSSCRKDISFYEKHLKQFTWEKHVNELFKIIYLFGSE